MADNIPGGTAEFPTGKASMTASTTIPSSNQIINPNTGGTVIAGGGSTSGGASIGQSIGKIAGSAIGSAFGPIGSAVGGFFGDLFGGLFAEGGPVDQKDMLHKAIGLGYTIGALHQRDFGGTPQTLSQASDMVKQMMQPTMASGGEVNNAQAIQQAIAQAMGLGDQSQTPNAVTQVNQQQAPMSGNAPNTPVAPGSPTGMLNLQEQANSGNPQAQSLEQRMQSQPKGFAAGGAGMMAPPPEQQSVGPGQTFQGDGSVKGPGGPTDDAIPAKLSNGEFVMSAPAVKFFGVDKLNQMNEKGKQGYMQALGQVQQDQQGAPQGAPQPPTPGAAQQQMPPSSPAGPPGGSPDQPMKSGGMATRNTKQGYCGL